MAIRMKIPRSNIYLQSGSLFFAKDSFQVSLYTVRTRYRDCIILLFASIFSSFSLATSQLLFPEATGLFRNTFISFPFPPSETEDSMRTRVDVNARSRGPAFSALESRRLPAIIRARPWKKDCYQPSLTRR